MHKVRPAVPGTTEPDEDSQWTRVKARQRLLTSTVEDVQTGLQAMKTGVLFVTKLATGEILPVRWENQPFSIRTIPLQAPDSGHCRRLDGALTRSRHFPGRESC